MPILVEMTISNKNEKPYEWWIDTPEAEYKNFDFVLVDDHSVEVKRTAFHRPFVESGSLVMARLDLSFRITCSLIWRLESRLSYKPT